MFGNSSFGSQLRYGVGKSAFKTIEFLLAHGLFPLGSRFPVGVLFQHDLPRFLGGQPELILDVGANVGQSALAFARACPNAKIHSFEPVRATFEQLVRRCAGHPQIHCHHCALGDVDGELCIQLQENSELNSLLVAADAAAAGTSERVQVRRLDEFVRELGSPRVDLLKIDAEGFELQVLAGAGALLRERKVRAVYAECRFSRDEIRQVLFEDLDRRLTGEGYRFSGFYEVYRWGAAKAWAGFANGLWLLGDQAELGLPVSTAARAEILDGVNP